MILHLAYWLCSVGTEPSRQVEVGVAKLGSRPGAVLVVAKQLWWRAGGEGGVGGV